MPRCRSCNQEIRWCETATGQKMPVDLMPEADGSLMILPTGRIRVVPVEDRAACVAPLYKSHFATCPHAEQHRQKLRKGGRPVRDR